METGAIVIRTMHGTLDYPDPEFCYRCYVPACTTHSSHQLRGVNLTRMLKEEIYSGQFDDVWRTNEASGHRWSNRLTGIEDTSLVRDV